MQELVRPELSLDSHRQVRLEKEQEQVVMVKEEEEEEFVSQKDLDLEYLQGYSDFLIFRDMKRRIFPVEKLTSTIISLDIVIRLLATHRTRIGTSVITDHTNDKSNQWQCDKKYKSKSDLKRHKLKHAGINAFECDECGKKFNRKDVLKSTNCRPMKPNIDIELVIRGLQSKYIRLNISN